MNKKKVPDLAKAGDWQQAQIKYPRVLRGLFFRAHQTAQEERHPLGHLGGKKSLQDDEAQARMDHVGFLLFCCHHSSKIGGGGTFEGSSQSTLILQTFRKVKRG